MRLIAAVLVAVVAMPSSAQNLHKAARAAVRLPGAAKPRDVPRSIPTPSPAAEEAIPAAPPMALGLRAPSPRPACDPQAFALAWQAFIDSPAPATAAPPCDPDWPHPSLICASLQRSADRAAEEAAEQEYRRRLDEVNAHAARCR